MDNFFRVELLNNKEYYFRELTLKEYKNLQKMCVEDDMYLFIKYSDMLLEKLCVDGDISELNIFDKFIALLMIRYYSVSDEKHFITYFKGKSAKMPVKLERIVNRVYEELSSLDNIHNLPMDDFLADSIDIDVFDIDSPIKSFNNGNKKIPYTEEMEDLIPLNIHNRISEFIDEKFENINELELFHITSKDGHLTNVYFSTNYIQLYQLIKLFLKDDLAGLYQNLYDLKSKIKISFDEHDYITYSEYEVYISLFNSEQEEINKQQESGESGLPPMDDM